MDDRCGIGRRGLLEREHRVADVPPNCSTADVAGVAAGVTAATSAYLFTHPDVNGFVTGLKGESRDEQRAKLQAYLADNPQTAAEVRPSGSR